MSNSKKKGSSTAKPFVKGRYLLKKYPGKGGWTYLSFPAPKGLPKTRFGARYVKGRLDKVTVNGLSIWSTKAGGLFFPVKVALRKALGKQEGDTVLVELYHENEVQLPSDFRLVLEEEPAAARKFNALTPGRQRAMVSWIENAKRDETRINRMSEALRTLAGD